MEAMGRARGQAGTVSMAGGWWNQQELLKRAGLGPARHLEEEASRPRPGKNEDGQRAVLIVSNTRGPPNSKSYEDLKEEPSHFKL